MPRGGRHCRQVTWFTVNHVGLLAVLSAIYDRIALTLHSFVAYSENTNPPPFLQEGSESASVPNGQGDTATP